MLDNIATLSCLFKPNDNIPDEIWETTLSSSLPIIGTHLPSAGIVLLAIALCVVDSHANHVPDTAPFNTTNKMEAKKSSRGGGAPGKANRTPTDVTLAHAQTLGILPETLARVRADTAGKLVMFGDTCT